MSRKFACLILAVTTLISCTAVVQADAIDAKKAAYAEAVAAAEEAGVGSYADVALTDGRGMALAVELGLLDTAERSGTASLAELSVQALQEQQEQQRLAEEEAQAEARTNAYLALYDGVMIEDDEVTMRRAADDGAKAVRTLSAGKVAKLLGIPAEGWYQVSFGNSTGYIPADSCRGVSYADYAGSRAARDLLEELIDYAYTYLGTPYAYGGSSYSGTDCSGFTMRVFGSLGISLSHGCTSQYRRCTPVTTAERAAGDLVFFTAPGYSSIEHVGIYLGGGLFIHASSSKGVVVSSMYESYYAEHYYGAGRITLD